MKCWEEEPEDRPTFAELVKLMKASVQQLCPDLSLIPPLDIAEETQAEKPMATPQHQIIRGSPLPKSTSSPKPVRSMTHGAAYQSRGAVQQPDIPTLPPKRHSQRFSSFQSTKTKADSSTGATGTQVI